MSSVKRTGLKRLCVVAAGLALLGCSSAQLSRLAPPGILKYEEIASEKPPNPAIKEAIAARRETEHPRFPVLSRTPAAGKPPLRPEQTGIDAQSAELTAARESLAGALDADRAAAETDREDRATLDASRDGLAAQLEKDEAAAQRDRARPMPTQPDE